MGIGGDHEIDGIARHQPDQAVYRKGYDHDHHAGFTETAHDMARKRAGNQGGHGTHGFVSLVSGKWQAQI